MLTALWKFRAQGGRCRLAETHNKHYERESFRIVFSGKKTLGAWKRLKMLSEPPFMTLTDDFRYSFGSSAFVGRWYPLLERWNCDFVFRQLILSYFFTVWGKQPFQWLGLYRQKPNNYSHRLHVRLKWLAFYRVKGFLLQRPESTVNVSTGWAPSLNREWDLGHSMVILECSYLSRILPSKIYFR